MLIGIIILVIVVLLVVFLIAAYNGLVKARNRVDNAFSQIEVQQKRRSGGVGQHLMRTWPTSY